MTRTRGNGFDAPAWWLERARSMVSTSPAGLMELGRVLARYVARPAPWHHSVLSRFVDGARPTIDLAIAISGVFAIPCPVHVARTEVEAVALDAVAKLGLEVNAWKDVAAQWRTRATRAAAEQAAKPAHADADEDRR